MKKIICDFCGKDISINDSITDGGKIIMEGNMPKAGSWKDHFDLCVTCLESARNILLQKVTKEEAKP